MFLWYTLFNQSQVSYSELQIQLMVYKSFPLYQKVTYLGFDHRYIDSLIFGSFK
jgi:hypothetical protein